MIDDILFTSINDWKIYDFTGTSWDYRVVIDPDYNSYILPDVISTSKFCKLPKKQFSKDYLLEATNNYWTLDNSEYWRNRLSEFVDQLQSCT